MNYDLRVLDKECEKLHIVLNDRQREQFIQYYEILVEWNNVINLTAITEFEDVLLKHFADSLSIVRVLDMQQVQEMIDVGTGAGFPGIPLKIVFPHLKLTLLDSLKKRISFLDQVTAQLQLEDVEVIHGRAEEYARQKNYRESYDLCVSRAVANLAVLSEYCIPYVKEQGYFIPYKSAKIEEEIEESSYALKVLGGKLVSLCKFQIGEDKMERSFPVIRKNTATPGKYPRRAGTPSREPLR